jgi:peptide/nickel transport system substrate-binding protein
MRLRRPTSVRTAGVLAVALAATAALAACSSSSGTSTATGSTGNTSSSGNAAELPSQYGQVPLAAADTGKSGTITFGLPTSAAPTWILPIVPGANGSVYEQYMFIQPMWRPLYWTDNGVHPVVDDQFSIANEPTWSNNDQTVTFTLKPNYKWSDGQPVTSADVLFEFYLLKAALKENPANWSQYVPALGIPDQVTSVSAPNSTTVVMNMNKPVNPEWFLENGLSLLNPMPEHAWAKASANGPILNPAVPANAKAIWDYLYATAKDTSTYASNPMWQLVDGPYKLASFNSTTGSYTMVPNPTYGGPHAKVVSTFKVEGYASQTAEWNAVKSGALDMVADIPSQDIPQVPSISGQYNDFGYPSFGFNYAVYNFKDKTGDFNNVIGQLYIRQVIASLEDEQGIIRAFFHGAAGQSYGPVPSIPSTPYTPADALTNPYPYSVSGAISALKAHGWTVNTSGTDVCSNAGTGANQCGAGIPAGTKLAWNLVYDSTTQVTTEIVQNLASDLRQAGITVNLQSSNFNTMIQDDNDPTAPKNDDKWAMEDFGGFGIDDYPTMLGIFNTTGTYDIGGYSDPKADALMNASVSSSNPDAVKNEASYLTQQQPSLFQPNQDRIAVWIKTLSGPPATFQALTQNYVSPEMWYFTK